MRLLQSTIVLALASCFPLTALANGLLYKLPADGSQIVYDMKMVKKGRNMTNTGTLSISSVDKATVDGKKCRWIEFSMKMSFMGRDRTTTAKVLIPEAELGKGKNPLKNFKRGWIKHSGQEVKEIKDFNSRQAGPLPAFLPGPLSGRKELKSAEIDSGIGKLKCKGETGSVNYKQGSIETKVEYETRLNEKSPFGVVSSKLTIQETGNGKLRDTYEISFKLKSVAKNAKSALPDQK
ncbi:MAG: hypothetical protein IID45_07255 [Planctomycetes bacterium]|nr:hypothetical protein [Planctomycetota bacterium]